MRSTGSTPVQHQHVVGREIAADVALLHADAARGGFGPSGSFGFASDPGRLAGYLHELIAVAAESPGAASVVNAVLLNALLSKVHEATGATESCAVGLPRSVVRCLFEASVFPRGVGVRQGRRGALAVSDVFFTRGGRFGGEPRGGVIRARG